jgi:CDP-diacylglycerol---serine O-phosphatidyltransferase
MRFKNNIPNFITLLNLLSGAVAIIMVFSGELKCASWFIVLAAVFDFCDGFAARLLHAKSNIGAQLDSLADVISFGLAPSAIMYQLMLNSPVNPDLTAGGFSLLPYTALLLAAAGAYRLARFNTDPGQESEFKGLPIPANGLFVASLPLIISQAGETPLILNLLGNITVLFAIVVCLSWLMVSNVPMLSLKLKNLRWKDNFYRFILIILSVIFIAFFRFIAVPFIIILYILLSVISLSLNKEK